MTNEQTVVDQTDDAAKPLSEEGSAQDIDSLLSEYNSGEPKDPPAKDEKVTLEALLPEIKFLKEERERVVREGAEKAFDATVKSIKGDLAIPEKIVKAYLNQEALERPGLKEAYLDREKNPQKWAKIEAAFQKELKEIVSSLPSKDATSIANQVESAVRNAQPQTPNLIPPDINTMSDTDFEAAKKRMFKEHATV